mmetsp:Transcript_23043/g.35566  ORF Transcript_23043/g.35566 Transcript_23043/m.35566 type:complete len:453 (+) Transcript_23043:82-1440(+)
MHRWHDNAKFAMLLIISSGVDAESRAYSLGCMDKPRSYYDYDNFILPTMLMRHRDNYQLLKKLGSGKFSDVFEAVDCSNGNNISTYNSSGGRIGSREANTPNEANDDYSNRVVIKCLKPVNERKIRREVLVLSHCTQIPNLAKLIGVIWEDYYTDHSREHHASASTSTKRTSTNLPPSLILQHAGPNARWLCHGTGMDAFRNRDVATSSTNPTSTSSSAHNSNANSMYLTEEEIKYFVYQLLIALNGLHSQGIIHRDVKPRNVLISRGNYCTKNDGDNSNDNTGVGRSLMLIDLGLADFYIPGQRYNVRVASRHYKSPELLVGYEYYDYALDMWGVGCILAGLLLRREPFFRGRDNVDQLAKIAAVLGTPDLLKYCDRYNVRLPAELRKAVGCGTERNTGRRLWDSMCAPGCPTPSAEGKDLIDRLLVYDHFERLSAAEAMLHPFFDSVRGK